MKLSISQTGTVCATGIGARQCAASFRAGLSGYAQSTVMGRGGDPLVMALVPEAHLDPLRPELAALPISDRERRMLRLGGMALDQVRPALRGQPPVYLAVPDASSRRRNFAESELITQLAEQAQLNLNLEASRVFSHGRAGGFYALQAAMAALRAGRDSVLVGGIDTPLDLVWLAQRDAEQRLLGPDVKDGFVPGEAAAFLLLERASGTRGAPGCTWIEATGTAEDPGHRYSDAPSLGVGLAVALDAAMAQLPTVLRIKTCFAGLNGESFGAKAWGVAHIRHHERFDAALFFEHPADCFGDVGAAMGPLLIALADHSLRAGHRPGPILAWAASDYAPVGCTYLSNDKSPSHSG